MEYEELLCSPWLENILPTTLHYRQPESFEQGWVFWSQDEGSQINPSSAPLHPLMPYENIISAFSKLGYFLGKLIFQLWAPVIIGSRHLLSTSCQPFAFNYLHKDHEKYRQRSLEYHYNIDVNNQLHVDKEEENQGYPGPMILDGGPAAAFLNCMLEYAHLKDHQGSPLARYALDCGLVVSFMLPICSPSQTSSCIGVVECTIGRSYNPEILQMIITTLKKAGLSICPVQERIPYKTINGLKPARDDIEGALKIICGSHNLLLAQVWVAHADEIHVPFSSSLEDTRMKRMIALKLTGYVNKDSTDFDDYAADYYDMCGVVYLKEGEELVEKTLQDYKPFFCKNISNLNHTLMSRASYEGRESSGVAVCLRSIDTGDLDYAFEFIWHYASNYVILLEAVLSTLKRCLPCFKFASGAELGDELEFQVINFKFASGAELDKELEFHVINDPLHSDAELGDKLVLHSNAENIKESEIKNFIIFQGKKSSPLSIALAAGNKPMVVHASEAKWKTAPKELPREAIEEQFGNTMKEAAENLNVSLSTLKRKCKGFGIKEWQGRRNVVKKVKVNASSNNQSNKNEEDNGTIQEPSVVNRKENTLTIKAEYAGDTIKFDLHISDATFVNIEQEMGMNFKLTLGTYKLNYCDEDGDWILLASDQHMKYCIKRLINLGQTLVRLRVLLSP